MNGGKIMVTQEKTQILSGKSDEHRQDTVTIKINNVAYTIHRGRQSVSEIKHIGGISQADVLEQLIDGQLVELDDNGAVTIKGEEQFISHPRDSASS